jgi:biopolymer transport protein ExbD
VRPAGAASWTDLDAGTVAIAKVTAPLEQAAKFAREIAAVNAPPVKAIAEWDSRDGGALDLALLDPPPPPEADSDRAEGEYKMKGSSPTPTPPRATVWSIPYDPHPTPHADGSPARAAQIVGAVVEHGNLDPMKMLIGAPPTLPASSLVDAVSQTRGAIAVTQGGHIRPLRLQFTIDDSAAPEPRYWLEVRVSATGAVVEAVPDVPLPLATLDPKELVATLARARATHGANVAVPVDVLVDADVTSQRLIDVLAALDAAGERAIGLGVAPTAEELARRGHQFDSERR